MTSSFGTPGDTYYNPKTELNYVLGSDFAWRVDVSKGAGKSLHFKGPITPPSDPATLLPAPEVGDYFIYDSDGVAWNGDDVLAGNWVIYNVPNGWKNYSIRQDTGVMSVDVSGGILSLTGTPADPVIDLDAADLEAALDGRYLRLDGTNDYGAQKLNFIPPSASDAVTLNTNGAGGLAFALSNVNTLTVNPAAVTSAKPIIVENAGAIEFKGSSGNRLNMEGTRWGALSSNGTPQLEWGGSGLKLRQEFNVNNKNVINVKTPSEDDHAVNKEYVDTLIEGLELTPATTTTLGGVIVGDGLNVTVNGTLSVSSSNPDFVKRAGDSMNGTLHLRNTYFLEMKKSDNTSPMIQWLRQTDSEVRQFLRDDVTFKITAQDNGTTQYVLRVASKSAGNGNAISELKYLKDPVDDRDAVNLKTLEEYFDELEEKVDNIDVDPDLFVKKTGDTMTGPLSFSSNGTVAIIKDDNGSGNLVNKLVKVRGTNKFKLNFYPDQSDTGSKTAFEGSWDQATGFPVIKLNYLQDPSGAGNPVNLRYANANYLQLTGGDLTGQVNTSALLKSTRTSGGAFEVKPSGLSYATALINANGELKLKPNIGGSSYIFSVYAKGLSSNMDKVAFRVTADGKVKAGHDTSTAFMATADNDVVTKKKLDAALAAFTPSSGNMKVQIVSSTPSSVTVGDIWLNTSDNFLYIKTS